MLMWNVTLLDAEPCMLWLYNSRDEAKRDDSPDNMRLPGGGDIYGGDDSLAAAKARCDEFSMNEGMQSL